MTALPATIATNLRRSIIGASSAATSYNPQVVTRVTTALGRAQRLHACRSRTTGVIVWAPRPRRVAEAARSSRTRGWRGGTRGVRLVHARRFGEERVALIGGRPMAPATHKSCARCRVISSCSATTSEDGRAHWKIKRSVPRRSRHQRSAYRRRSRWPLVAEWESSLVRSERRVASTQRTSRSPIRLFCTVVALAA